MNTDTQVVNPLTDVGDPHNLSQPNVKEFRGAANFEDVDLLAQQAAAAAAQAGTDTVRREQTAADLLTLGRQITQATTTSQLNACIVRLNELAPLNSDLLGQCSLCRSHVLTMMGTGAASASDSADNFLFSWPVLSINEWGLPQFRVLVLTMNGIFRCTSSNGSVTRCTFVPYNQITQLELHGRVDNTIAGIRQEGGFNIYTENLDGNRNPIVVAMSKLPTKKPADPHANKNRRIYRPVLPLNAASMDLTDLSLVVATIILTAGRLCTSANIKFSKRDDDGPVISPRVTESIRKRVHSVRGSISNLAQLRGNKDNSTENSPL